MNCKHTKAHLTGKIGEGGKVLELFCPDCRVWIYKEYLVGGRT